MTRNYSHEFHATNGMEELFFSKLKIIYQGTKYSCQYPLKSLYVRAPEVKNAFTQQRAKIGQRALNVAYLTLLCNKIKNWCALLMPSLYLQLLISGASACAKRAQLSAIPIEIATYRCQKIWYDVSVRKPTRTDSVSRGKKLRRVGKGVRYMYIAFRFWRKTNHFRGNRRSCWSKNLDLTKCLEITF